MQTCTRLLLAATFSLAAAVSTHAGSFGVGLQSSLGSDHDFGAGVRVTAQLDRIVKHLEATTAFDYFFSNGELGVDVTYVEFTAGLAYRFGTGRTQPTPYAGAGLQIARFEASTRLLGVDISGDETRTYPAIYGGLLFRATWASPFIEARIAAGEGGQAVLTAGLRF